MGNGTLDPRSLTSEERAIVEEMVTRLPVSWGVLPSNLGGNSPYWLGYLTQLEWSQSYESAFDRILARRAIFAEPASEGGKVECPNCHHEDTGHAWKVNGELRYSCKGWNKPAQPEPVAAEGRWSINTVAGETFANWVKPAPAVAMTEELEVVLDYLEEHCDWTDSRENGPVHTMAESHHARACIAAVREQFK